MTAFLRLEAYDPRSTGLTLIDASVPSSQPPQTALLEPDWGNAEWEQVMGGPRGTLGSVLASQTPKNRVIALPLRIYGTSKDNLAARLSALHEVVDLMRRYGGRVTRRSHNQSYRQHLEVLATPGVMVRTWGQGLEVRDRADVVFSAVCAPYVEGDAMDVLDQFDSNSVADYGTVDSGATGNFTVGSGVVAFGANLSTQNRVIHTSRGYLYGDHLAAVSFTPGSTITNARAGVVLKRRSSTNRIDVYLVDNGVNLSLAIDVNGVNRASVSTSGLRFNSADRAPFIVVGWVEGNVVYARAYSRDTSFVEPTPIESTDYVLTTAEQAVVGANNVGQAGWTCTPQHASARLNWFRVVPYNYGWNYGASGTQVQTGLTLTMHGAIPGDAPALLRFNFRSFISGLLTYGVLAAWTRVPDVTNMVQQGHFEFTTDPTYRWSVSAVTGVTGAATSINRDTTLARTKFGDGNAVIVTPATANTGASHQIHRHFLRGRQYVAMLWASAATATTATRLRLGVNGDIASETAAALTTTPTLRTVTWTPTALRNNAYVAFEVTAATATTMNIDGVCVFESRPAWLSAAISSTTATTCTIDAIPDQWPTTAFFALVDSEIIRVEPVTSTTLTIARGQYGTTAATHVISSAVHVLPDDDGLQGLGAPAAFGAIAGSDAYIATSGSSDAAAPANALYSVMRTGSTVNIGATVQMFLNTRALPDVGKDGEIPLECWARVRVPATGVTPAVKSNVNGTTPVEYATAKTITKPTAAEWRFVRVGTHRARSGLNVAAFSVYESGAGSGSYDLDHIVLVPANQRVVTPSGKTDLQLVDTPIHIHPDLQVSTIGSWVAGKDQPLSGWRSPIGGTTMEANPGVQALFVKVSDAGFEVPAVTANEDDITGMGYSLQVIPTPRWAILRDA